MAGAACRAVAADAEMAPDMRSAPLMERAKISRLTRRETTLIFIASPFLVMSGVAFHGPLAYR
jgi:hypothetical protein